jgi:DNA-binding transcriptional regulator YiaG
MGGTKKTTWNGERVKALRGHLRMTQQGLAAEMGIRQQTVSEWETGLYQPRGASERLLSLIAERAEFVYEADGPGQESESSGGAA